jgi:hypothetical protein
MRHFVCQQSVPQDASGRDAETQESDRKNKSLLTSVPSVRFAYRPEPIGEECAEKAGLFGSESHWAFNSTNGRVLFFADSSPKTQGSK